jgi:hypothetical protein
MAVPTQTVALPELWSDWRKAVNELVTALTNTLALYTNPTTPIARTAMEERVRQISEKLAVSREKARAVGTESERVAVSRTLRRLHADAEKWSERMVSSAKNLDLNDSDTVQRWYAQVLLPINELRCGMMHRGIRIEMEEAALAAPVSPALPVPQYVTRDQMAAICKKNKKTITRWLEAEQLPPPDVEGGRGKADEWIWATVRPHLEAATKHTLPVIFPEWPQNR